MEEGNNKSIDEAMERCHGTAELHWRIDYVLSGDSSIAHALSESEEQVQRNSTENPKETHLIKQIPYQSKQRKAFEQAETHFRVNGSLGIVVEDALNDRFEGLDDADEPVFYEQMAEEKITIRIQPDGYKAYRGSIRVKNLGFKSRSKIVRLIAQETANFRMKKIAESSETRDSFFREGDRKLLLVGLKRVSKGSWQPVYHYENALSEDPRDC
ncbi:hypothetical protein B0H21DRAFT_718295 [Amylocystis lapponica]|nr:hypothetical protein B0H21DRAFT_718295 [Amylocystis lapponica]